MKLLIHGAFDFYIELLARSVRKSAAALGLDNLECLVEAHAMAVRRRLAEESWDVLLFEVAVPQAPEKRLLAECRAQAGSTRLVVLATSLDWETETELVQAGADLCFEKPSDPEKLRSFLHVLAALCARRRSPVSGSFKGISSQKLVQLLQVRGETGTIRLETEHGEGVLELVGGRLVDARLGAAAGEAAAAQIITLGHTTKFFFRPCSQATNPTVHIDRQELLALAAKSSDASPPARRDHSPLPLRETLRKLEDQEELHVELELGFESSPALPTPPRSHAKISQRISKPNLPTGATSRVPRPRLFRLPAEGIVEPPKPPTAKVRPSAPNEPASPPTETPFHELEDRGLPKTGTSPLEPSAAPPQTSFIPAPSVPDQEALEPSVCPPSGITADERKEAPQLVPQIDRPESFFSADSAPVEQAPLSALENPKISAEETQHSAERPGGEALEKPAEVALPTQAQLPHGVLERVALSSAGGLVEPSVSTKLVIRQDLLEFLGFKATRIAKMAKSASLKRIAGFSEDQMWQVSWGDDVLEFVVQTPGSKNPTPTEMHGWIASKPSQEALEALASLCQDNDLTFLGMFYHQGRQAWSCWKGSEVAAEKRGEGLTLEIADLYPVLHLQQLPCKWVELVCSSLHGAIWASEKGDFLLAVSDNPRTCKHFFMDKSSEICKKLNIQSA